MTWLMGQLWPLLLVAFLLGAATVVAWALRRESVEVWEDAPVPVAPRAGALAGSARGAGGTDSPVGSLGPDDASVGVGAGTEELSPTSVTAPAPVDADDPDSPFPVAASAGTAPWEADELWSRPARVAAPGESRRPKDEWTEAAENWRSWADEVTGRGFAADDVVVGAGGGAVSARDRDLFAADREPDGGGDSAAASSRAVSPDGDEELTEVFPAFPGGSEQEDAFPYARPVEAPRGGDETMDPMDTHDMTDDEREAAEIRRMREQARRGDSA